MVSQSYIAAFQPIAVQHATLEIGSANSTALFSHVFFSQSALATTVVLKATAAFHLLTRVGTVVLCGFVTLH
jgi:hypothetical protein